MARFRRILTFVMCVTMLFCATVTAEPSQVHAAKSDELQSQLDAAKEESNRIKAEIANLKAANAPYTQQRARSCARRSRDSMARRPRATPLGIHE